MARLESVPYSIFDTKRDLFIREEKRGGRERPAGFCVCGGALRGEGERPPLLSSPRYTNTNLNSNTIPRSLRQQKALRLGPTTRLSNCRTRHRCLGRNDVVSESARRGRRMRSSTRGSGKQAAQSGSLNLQANDAAFRPTSH
eukprot:scaffold148701_cov31-Tisochrysis_lutea.AAC.4